MDGLEQNLEFHQDKYKLRLVSHTVGYIIYLPLWSVRIYPTRNFCGCTQRGLILSERFWIDTSEKHYHAKRYFGHSPKETMHTCHQTNESMYYY